MRKTSCPVNCRQYVLLFIFAIISVSKLFAQVDIKIGTGIAGNTSTGYPCPLQDEYEGSRAQYMYLASELTAAGMTAGSINSIKFRILDLNSTELIENYTVRMGHSTQAGLSATSWETVSSTVFGPVDYQPVNGINTLILSSSFTWNGTDNIIIEICNGASNTTSFVTNSDNPSVEWSTAIGFNGSHTYRVSNLNNLCGTTTTTNTGTQTTRPNVIFEWVSSSVCSGAPAAGTTTSDIATICNPIQLINLNITNGSTQSGLTYQWQHSADNNSWTNISGAVSYNYSFSGLLTSTYFRRQVTCSGQSSYSNPLLITVNGPSFAAVPFYESFENPWINGCGTSDIPNNFWRTDPLTGNNAWRRNDDPTSASWTSQTSGGYTPTASDGSFSARFHSYIATAGLTGTMDLYINLQSPITTKRLSFDFINTNGTDSIVVFISTDAGRSFSRLDSVINSTEWKTKFIDFSSLSDKAVIRFVAYSDNGTTDFGLDNVRVFDFVACSGVPVTGTVEPVSTTVCIGEPVTLNTNGFPVQDGLTYQWQSSSDNSAWVDISGATGMSYTGTQASATYYRLKVTCASGGLSASSSAVLIGTPLPAYASLPFTESFENTWMDTCALRNIPTNFWRNLPSRGNASWRRNDDGMASAGWTNNSGAYTPASADGEFSARFHSFSAPKNAIGNFDLYINANTAVANKKLTFEHINISGTDSLVILISENGGIDFVRLDSLRLSTSWRTKSIEFTSSSAITVIRFQAYSDFGSTDIGIDKIAVVDLISCSGTPVAGSAASSAADVCPGTVFTLSGTGILDMVGLTFQWQSSADNVSWTNISGAKTLEYSLSQNTSSYYRVIVNCALSSESATSIPVLVTVNSRVYAGLPYSESFENIWKSNCGLRDVPNYFWKSNPSTANNSWRRNDDPSSASWTSPTLGTNIPASTDGNFAARFHSYTAADGSTGALDLYINAAGGSTAKRLTFDYINRSGDDSLTVLISIDGGINFIRLDSLDLRAVWDTKTIDFVSSSATTVIRFLAQSDNGTTDIYIDNIHIAALPECTGTPATAVVVSTLNNACLDIPFTLSLTEMPGVNGLSYQWQSSTDSISWTNISGAFEATITTSQNQSLYYRMIVTCTSTGETSGSAGYKIVTPTPVSGNFTIDKNAPAGNGNFQSFNAAYDYLKCGIGGPVVFTVNAGSGPYNEQLIMNAVPGASSINTITFLGNGNTIAFESTVTGQRAVIKFEDADHIILDSLVVDARGGTYGYGVQLINNADSNIIRNSMIFTDSTSTSESFGGIIINASHTDGNTTGNTFCDDNEISLNTISGGYYGITIVGSTTQSVQRNKVLNNKVTGWYQYGVYVLGSYLGLVEGNDINKPYRLTSASTNYGIYVSGLNASLNITRNKIHDVFGNITTTNDFNGIYFANVDALPTRENIVTNNVIYNIYSRGEINGIYNSGSDNTWYYHNTISLDDASTTGTEVTRGFYQNLQAAGIEFRNNLISIRRGGTGLKYGIYIGNTATEYLSDNNNIYVSEGNNNYIGFRSIAYNSLIDWQVATTQDILSLSVDPRFADLAIGDYKPTAPAMDDRGAAAGVSVDILNVLRNDSLPDIGAYEYTPVDCVTPPTAGKAVSTDSTGVCPNTLVGLNLQGNSEGRNQQYLWQSASSAAGPWANISDTLSAADFKINPTSTQYYRAVVTCGGMTVFSDFVLITVNPAFASGTYTIDAGNPTGGTNFKSFNDAYNAVKCGITGPVVFNVVPGSGPYNEQLIIDPVFGASSTNTITFNGNGDTLQFRSDDNVNRAVIKLRGADHFIFDNLLIKAGGGTYGYGVQLINNADSNIIRNNTILTDSTATTENFGGIIVNASHSDGNTTGATLSDYNEISGNKIRGGNYGITLVGSGTQVLAQNKITGNSIDGWYQYGIYVYGSSNMLIENNDIRSSVRTENASTSYGIYMTNLNTAARVSKNRIHSIFAKTTSTTNTFNGIYLTASDAPEASENIFSNNIIYDILGNGAVYGIYNNGSDNALYFHNTISLDDRTSQTSGITRAFHQVTAAEGIQFRNNMISILRGGSGITHGIYMGTTDTKFLSDNNNFYIAKRASNFVGYNGINRISLAEWQISSGKDSSSISANPIFTDPASGNFIPVSPVVDNKGANVGIDSDINGLSRSTTTPDIGVYETTVQPCTAPPVAGAAVANPVSGICMGTPIDLKLAGVTWDAGQSYQWEYATAAAGPYTAMGGSMLLPDTIIEIQQTYYYRVAVTCGTFTSYSTPVLVTMNPAFPGGTYTINNSIPTGGINFNSFREAVAALECGISGPVYFDVAPGTFTEQIRMHKIRGAANDRRVTFRSQNGDASSVILTYAVSTVDTNYVLKLDSASYITYRNLTITATDMAAVPVKGRAVQFSNTASSDSLLNCIINVPVSTGTSEVISGVFANDLKGINNVISGNTINNGAFGIYISGVSPTEPVPSIVIDSNKLSGFNNYGVYVNQASKANVSRNAVSMQAPLNTEAFGIYVSNLTEGYLINANSVNINSTVNTIYGIFLSQSAAGANDSGSVSNNKILALTANTGNIYGLYQDRSTYNNTRNNVINIHSSGSIAYGIYSTGGGGINYHNNSVYNADSATGSSNYAVYFNHSSSAAGAINIRNNIFSHGGGGRSMYVANPNFISSDYNLFYTDGAAIIQWGTANSFNTLKKWRDTSYWDINSIVIKPAIAVESDLQPVIGKDSVWAMHGRGVQIEGNNADINNNPRATVLTAGVPDLGAYEFSPAVLPPSLDAKPATPAPGIEQTFMFGTDTVSKITWAPGSIVPASLELRRYSGINPVALATGTPQMFFYTDVDVTGSGTFDYKIKQFYVDSWLGSIPDEEAIGLGRTNSTGNWMVDSLSAVNDIINVISSSDLDSLDKFTGLVNTLMAVPEIPTFAGSDSSNRGKNFWVGYANSYDFYNSNSQDMILYLSTDNNPATVTVKVNGTGWSRTYHIPANTAISTETMPKNGLFDSRLISEGKFSTGISISSDVPITAYAHIYYSTNSGATMLLPVGTYGYEYFTLNSRQNYSTAGSYSSFFVVADRNNTQVEITPSNPTLGGRAANVPFTVTLNKGEVYQVLGAMISGSDGYDLSGSKIKSIPNADGNCYPVAVFTGSSRTGLGCGSSAGSTGDLLFQQVFPSQAWGTRYLTAPTSTAANPGSMMTNMYRVLVKDASTVVRKNNVVLTGLVANRYYVFESNAADYIESDQPVMVAQYMSSSGSCTNTSGDGDPELFFLSPVEQAVKSATFYRNDLYSIKTNYLTLVIRNGGLSSLTIDGSSTFDFTYPHSQPGYTVVVKRWGAGKGQSVVRSDSGFTGIVYGMGSLESYGYNVGTLVKNLNVITSINNVYGNGETSEYTCTNAPFNFNILLPFVPNTLSWKLSEVAGLTPNSDIMMNNPGPVDSSVVNGIKYYKFTVSQQYNFTARGVYNVPVSFSHPSIESCDNSRELMLTVKVNASPKADFTVDFSNCAGSIAKLTGAESTGGVVVNQWKWDLPDATTVSTRNANYTFNTADTFAIRLQMISEDGCIADTAKEIIAYERPLVNLVIDSLSVCPGTDTLFLVKNPDSTLTYNWYNSATGTTPFQTANSYSISNATNSGVYYVEAVNVVCHSERVAASLNVLPVIISPVVTVDTVGTDLIRFTWNAVTDALGYEVTTDNGNTWISPSSGSTGLTHTMGNLPPLQTVTIRVRAIGGCQDATSLAVSERVLPDGIFIPNSFTPNGDGLNDVLKVYSYKIKEMQFMVFNQWGQKVFETGNVNQAWDGTFGGKLQSSGVYMYVCKMILQDGSVVNRKGSINLIR